MRPGSWLSMKNGALGGALLVHASDGVGASSAGDLVSHKVVRCTGAPRTLIAPWQPCLHQPDGVHLSLSLRFGCTVPQRPRRTQACSSTSATRRRQRSSRRAYSSTRMGAPARDPQPHPLPWLPLMRKAPRPTYQLAQSTPMRVRPRRYVLLRGSNAPWPSMTTVDGIFAAGQGVCSEPTRPRARSLT